MSTVHDLLTRTPPARLRQTETIMRIGQAAAADLEPVADYREIADAVGVKRGMAWRLSVIALGKLVIALHARVSDQ